jgi:hypothetical protein
MRYGLWLPALLVLLSVTQADAQTVTADPRELAAAPERYQGQVITLLGTALSARLRPDGSGRLQIMARVTGRSDVRESVIIEVPDASTGTLVEGDCYLVTGVGGGTTDVTLRLTGVRVAMPLLTNGQYQNVTIRGAHRAPLGNGRVGLTTDPCPSMPTVPTSRDPNVPGIGFGIPTE